MARGFKIADGFVEIRGEVDKNQIRRTSTRAGEVAGDHFSRAMDNRVGGRRFGRRLGRRLGRRVALTFTDAFGEGLLRPNPRVLSTLRTGVAGWMASPMGLAGLAAAAIFVASFVSAVLTSGALAALGVGFLGLGAFAVRESELVAASWKDTAAQISSALADSAKALVGPFADAADRIGHEFTFRLAPHLRSIFEQLAPAVDPLVGGLLDTVESFLARIAPNMSRLTHEFLIPFAEQLPRLGEALGAFVDTLVRNAPTVTEGFVDIVDVTVTLLDVLDDTLVILTRLWTWFNRIHGVVSPGTAAMRALSVETGGASTSISNFLGVINPVAGMMGLFRTGADEAAGAGRFLAGQIDVATVSMRDAITVAGDLAEVLDRLNGAALSAQIGRAHV